MTKVWPDHLVAVAEVLSPQGNRGEVKAMPLTGRPERFAELRAVTAWIDGTERPLTMVAWRTWRQYVILGFAELAEIEDAEAIRGALICVPSGERAALPPEEYYHDDLVGLAVATEAGQRLGRVVSILTTGANDVFVVTTDEGRELLLPALKSVVARVDLGARLMVIRPVPGLLD